MRRKNKHSISFEQEKSINSEIWNQIMLDANTGSFDIDHIVNTMDRLNIFDKKMIELNRRDLLG